MPAETNYSTAETTLSVGEHYVGRFRFVLVGTREPGDTPDSLVNKACARALASDLTARVNAELEHRGQDGRVSVDRIEPDYLNSTVQLDPDDPDSPYVTVYAICDVYGRCVKNVIPLLIWAIAAIIAVVVTDAVLDKYTGWGLIDASVVGIKKVAAGATDVAVNAVKDLGIPIVAAVAGGVALFFLLGK